MLSEKAAVPHLRTPRCILGSHGTHFWLSQFGDGRGPGHQWVQAWGVAGQRTSYAQDAPTLKYYPAQKVNSAMVGKPW